MLLFEKKMEGIKEKMSRLTLEFPLIQKYVWLEEKIKGSFSSFLFHYSLFQLNTTYCISSFQNSFFSFFFFYPLNFFSTQPNIAQKILNHSSPVHAHKSQSDSALDQLTIRSDHAIQVHHTEDVDPSCCTFTSHTLD